MLNFFFLQEKNERIILAEKIINAYIKKYMLCTISDQQ